MSNQKPSEQISKASYSLVEGIKDATTTNVSAAVRAGQVDVKPEALARLIIVINASIEEGYHKASRVFDRSVAQALTNAVTDAAMPSLEAKPKKK